MDALLGRAFQLLLFPTGLLLFNVPLRSPVASSLHSSTPGSDLASMYTSLGCVVRLSLLWLNRDFCLPSCAEGCTFLSFLDTWIGFPSLQERIWATLCGCRLLRLHCYVHLSPCALGCSFRMFLNRVAVSPRLYTSLSYAFQLPCSDWIAARCRLARWVAPSIHRRIFGSYFPSACTSGLRFPVTPSSGWIAPSNCLHSHLDRCFPLSSDI